MRNKQFRFFFNLCREREKRKYLARKKARETYGAASLHIHPHIYACPFPASESPSPPPELFFNLCREREKRKYLARKKARETYGAASLHIHPHIYACPFPASESPCQSSLEGARARVP